MEVELKGGEENVEQQKRKRRKLSKSIEKSAREENNKK